MAFLLFIGALLLFWVIVAIIGKNKSLNVNMHNFII